MSERPKLNEKIFAALFDHTVLVADATPKEILAACKESLDHGFYGVVVNPLYIPLVVKTLTGSTVKAVSVVGFPLGAVPTQLKVAATRWLVEEGADEIDMVMTIGSYLAGEMAVVQDDITAVIKAAGKLPVKVILETAYLRPEQIAEVSGWCAKVGAAFVKTSTGYGPRGVTAADLEAIAKGLAVYPEATRPAIKASGGIKTWQDAVSFYELGAARLGSSRSVELLASFVAARSNV